MSIIRAGALRFRLWWLWLRCTYAFRWGHRPLCARFRNGVFRVGDMFLCRSCLFAYAGLVATALLCFVSPWVSRESGLLLLALAAPTVAFSLPGPYHRLPRRVRDLLRFAMGACVSLCVCTMLWGTPFLGGSMALALFFFRRFYFARRQARRLAACEGCPELAAGGVCSGCRLQAEGLRRYEEQATALLLEAMGEKGFQPNKS